MTTHAPASLPLPDVPPVIESLRTAHSDLLDAANEAADRMRTGIDNAYQVGQAERSIAFHEAAASVRTILDLAENEYPPRG